jgi:hypothetical protein
VGLLYSKIMDAKVSPTQAKYGRVNAKSNGANGEDEMPSTPRGPSAYMVRDICCNDWDLR